MKKLIIFLTLLFPFYQIGYKYAVNDLGTNPVGDWILISGEYALGMLILTLACTPLRNLFKHAEFSQYKRMFGLFTFFYATVHLLTYAGLDYRFNFGEIYKQVIQNKFILVGFLAWVLLVPLAITSNNISIRLLKKKWKVLHKLVHVIAALAILHYVWLVKTVLWEPFIYSAVLGLLVMIRFISLRDFWFHYGGLVKMLLVMSPVLYLVYAGFVSRTPPQTVAYEAIQSALPKNQQAPHIYNEEYFVCYENSINAGETFEVRIAKCNKLWKTPGGAEVIDEPKKKLSIAEQKQLNIIKQYNGDY